MKTEDLQKKLTYTRKNFWKDFPEQERKAAFDFSVDYLDFLNRCKTERETSAYFNSKLSEKGFADLDGQGTGKRLYRLSRGKNVAIALVGNKPLSQGVNLIVSHIDTPRVDLKQNPISEDSNSGLGIIKTHYYGGIKKYQWMSTPLAIHGTVIKKDGEKVEVCLGEDEQDPVFVMPDLLPHLARKEQYTKKLGEAVAAGHMNVVFNSMPYLEDGKDSSKLKETVKLNALSILNNKYGIKEEDLLSAELQLVPAGKAREAGIDRSLIVAYGQDDRVCAYTSAEALFDLKVGKQGRTAVVYMADKEEIGSESNTGAKSIFILDFVADVLAANGEPYDSRNLRKTLINSQIISADVNAAINPNYPGVHEKENAVHLGCGVSVTKYTGSGGKYSTNDANAEYNARILRILNGEKVNWQIGTLGKVDEGGGGTIAKFMAEHGAEVIDCGPGVLGMHSLYELTSKGDVYSAYRAYKAFFEKA